jgi:hypothetical protein
MWFAVAAALAAAYANSGKWPTAVEPDRDWREMERERMAELRRETAATQRRAILAAFLFVALAAAIAYAVYQTIWGPA